jgi:hypothetical protein
MVNRPDYRRLAVAVMDLALRDFLSTETTLADDLSATQRARLELVAARRRHDAGAFLFERTDQVAALWRSLSGIDARLAGRWLVSDGVPVDRQARMAYLKADVARCQAQLRALVPPRRRLFRRHRARPWPTDGLSDL